MNFSVIRRFRVGFLAVAFLFSSFVAVTFAERNSAAPQIPSRVTFSRDIAAIVFRSCAPCHHAGEAGPFPLITYGDVKSHARQIADVTGKRLMPPWPPAQDGLPIEDDSHLSADQIALFQNWVADGTPEGDRDDLPPAPKFASGWQLGTPDLVLKATASFEVPASGSDVYWNLIFRSPLNSARFIKAIEIHPGEKRLVHHANLLVDRTQSARREEKSPGSGFAGMELQISFDPDGHFLFWKPGSPPSSNRTDWLCGSIPATISFSIRICSPPAKRNPFSPRSEFISPAKRPRNFLCCCNWTTTARSIFLPAIVIFS
jgi:hypothetical protein